MMRDISIDIEALGSGTNAALTQIGACYRVNPGGLATFFTCVDDPTGTFDPAAIRWHIAQGGRGILWNPEDGTGGAYPPLAEALEKFADWLGGGRPGDLLWTHATYDIPRLAEAYARAGWKKPPWRWPNCRDLRTLYDLAGGRPHTEGDKTHNALDDAIRQLEEIEECRWRLDTMRQRAAGE